VIKVPKKKAVSLDLSNSMLSRKWTECRERFKELEKKEREVGELLR